MCLYTIWFMGAGNGRAKARNQGGLGEGKEGRGTDGKVMD
jgi:hypothetical protein